MKKESLALCLCVLFFLTCIVSCKRGSESTKYLDRVAQDEGYRLGKWYSVSDTSGDAVRQINSLLDTIWFINDTLAGWTGFGGGNPYLYRTTYFPDPFHIVFLAQDIQNPNKIDTATNQCGMTAIGDTFIIYWFNPATYEVNKQYYLKKGN
jgi:hypothetical protein